MSNKILAIIYGSLLALILATFFIQIELKDLLKIVAVILFITGIIILFKTLGGRHDD